MSRREEFASLIVTHRPVIMGVILAMVEDFALSEDIFQNTVVEILDKADTVEIHAGFLPWAKGVARNMVRRHYRKEGSRHTPSCVGDLE